MGSNFAYERSYMEFISSFLEGPHGSIALRPVRLQPEFCASSPSLMHDPLPSPSPHPEWRCCPGHMASSLGSQTSKQPCSKSRLWTEPAWVQVSASLWPWQRGDLLSLSRAHLCTTQSGVDDAFSTEQSLGSDWVTAIKCLLRCEYWVNASFPSSRSLEMLLDFPISLEIASSPLYHLLSSTSPKTWIFF